MGSPHRLARVRLRETPALGRHPIHVRSLDPGLPVCTGLAVAPVVGEQENHVRSRRGRLRGRGERRRVRPGGREEEKSGDDPKRRGEKAGVLQLSTTDSSFSAGAITVNTFNATGEFDNVMVNSAN